MEMPEIILTVFISTIVIFGILWAIFGDDDDDDDLPPGSSQMSNTTVQCLLITTIL